LRVPHHENAIDKQIAATALTHDFILVTRNVDHFKGRGSAALQSFRLSPTNVAMLHTRDTRASSRTLVLLAAA
jgi:hypothetical protein